MDEFVGRKYKLTKSENFDDFMKASGMGLMVRKIVGFLSPTVELQKTDEDTYTLITSSTFRTASIHFKLGEEFNDTKPDGTVWKSVCSVEDNKLIQIQNRSDKSITIIREFGPKEMNVEMTIGYVVCTRVYTLVEG